MHCFITLAKIPEQEGSISPSSFYEDLCRYQLKVLVLSSGSSDRWVPPLAPDSYTCNLSRWNNRYNGNYKKDQKKLKHFEKIVFWNKFYIIVHFLSLCVFISIQNIGRSIPLTKMQLRKFNKYYLKQINTM